MTNEAFKKGFEALTATFPNMNFNGQLFWTILSDLDGQFFLMAVWDFISNTPDIFLGTNTVAKIRSKAIELQDKARQDNSLKLEAETEKERIDRWQKEATPMPEECKLALEKIGIKVATNP